MTVRWKNAPTRSVDVGGTKFAYRELGPDTGVPVIFLNHLAAELDRWDPRVVDGIAAKRRVIVFDNRGVGASKGSTPNSVTAMARDAIAFIRALGIDGFGMSSICYAQQWTFPKWSSCSCGYLDLQMRSQTRDAPPGHRARPASCAALLNLCDWEPGRGLAVTPVGPTFFSRLASAS